MTDSPRLMNGRTPGRVTPRVIGPALKPCPLCGGEATLAQVGAENLPSRIACRGCGYSMETGEVPPRVGVQWNQGPRTGG